MSREGIAIVAELKKASPSKGLIRADFQPATLARELELAGAAALSVLTDEEFFQGSLANLRAASAATSLPCLRKDFIVDEFQIVEARANAADAILLIVAALNQKELVALAQSARAHQLDVLCEAHDEQELDRALDAGCDLIGINSRDLRTFEVNLKTAFRLIEKIPEKLPGCRRKRHSFRRRSGKPAHCRIRCLSHRRIADERKQPRRSADEVARGIEAKTRQLSSSKGF